MNDDAEDMKHLRALADSLQPDQEFVAHLAARLEQSYQQSAAVETRPTINLNGHHARQKPRSMSMQHPSRTARSWPRPSYTLIAAFAALVLTLTVLIGLPTLGRLDVPLAQVAAPTAAPTPIPALPLPVGALVTKLSADTLGRMRDIGVTWISVEVAYRSNAMNENLYAANLLISAVQAQGFRALVTASQGTPVPPEDFVSQYVEFLRRLAALGPDAIQVWREPNIDLYWPFGAIDPARYVEILADAHEAIKSVNPSIKVISASPAPTNAQSVFSGRIMNDNSFYAGMAEAGAAQYLDCVGVQYVEGVVPPNAISGDPRGDEGTRYLQTMLTRAARPFAERGTTVPLCLTSLGYLSLEGLPDDLENINLFGWASQTSVAEQAAWIASALTQLTLQDTPQVELVILFSPDPLLSGDATGGYALIRPDGSCLACDTIAALRR